MRGAVNNKQIQSFIDLFKENRKLIYKHKEIIKYLLSVNETFLKSGSNYWDQLLSTERVLQLNYSLENSQNENLLQQISDLLTCPVPGSTHFYPIHLILQLIIFIFSLFRYDLSNSDDYIIKQALVQSILFSPLPPSSSASTPQQVIHPFPFPLLPFVTLETEGEFLFERIK